MNDTIGLSPALQEKVNSTLEPGEQVMWQGQPLPRFFTQSSLYVFLFGLVWNAFFVVGLLAALDLINVAFSGPRILFIPFFLMGLLMMSNPIWTRWRLSRILYVITDQRALIFHGGWGRSVQVIPVEKIEDTHRKGKLGKLGEVLISWQGMERRRHWMEVGFCGIEDHIEAQKILRVLMKHAAEASQLELPEQAVPKAE